MIELNKIDELLKEFKEFKNKGESFSEFIRVSKCIFDDKPALFDWVNVEEKHIEKVEED